VESHPDSSVSTTSAISSAPIAGGANGTTTSGIAIALAAVIGVDNGIRAMGNTVPLCNGDTTAAGPCVGRGRRRSGLKFMTFWTIRISVGGRTAGSAVGEPDGSRQLPISNSQLPNGQLPNRKTKAQGPGNAGPRCDYTSIVGFVTKGGRFAVGRLGVGSCELEVGRWKLGVGSWELGVGSWALGIGGWWLAVGSGPCPDPLKNCQTCPITSPQRDGDPEPGRRGPARTRADFHGGM